MVRFEDLIGKKISLALVNSEVAAYTVTLHGVEHGGIWVESKELDKLIGHQKSKSTGPRPATRPVVFYPYSQIFFLIAHSTEL
jgi:hypothetical protein